MKRLGYSWGVIFIFVCWMLIIESILVLVKYIKKIFSMIRDNQYRDAQREQQTKEILEALWTRVDEMSSVEKEHLKYFINNNNKPLLDRNISYPYEHLLNSDWVHKTQYTGNKLISRKVNIINDNGQTEAKEFTYSVKYQYILKEPIYKILKYSWERYGRISHFD